MAEINDFLFQLSPSIANLDKGKKSNSSGDSIPGPTGDFLFKPGLPGNQIAHGGTRSGGFLKFRSTAHPTKGFVFLGESTGLAFDETNTRVGLNQATPTARMHMVVGEPQDQAGAPSSQVARGDWTGNGGEITNMHLLLDETVADDSDYIRHLDNTTGTVILTIASMTDPGVDTGHYLRVRARKTSASDPGGIVLQVNMDNGGTSFFVGNITLTTSFATSTLNLTTAEAAAISSYSTIRFGAIVSDPGTGDGNVDISWVRFFTPQGPGAGGPSEILQKWETPTLGNQLAFAADAFMATTLELTGTPKFRIATSGLEFDIGTPAVGDLWRATDTEGTGAWASLATAGLAPNDAQYLTLALSSGLTAERVFAVGSNRISTSDGGANGNFTIDASMSSANWDWTRGITVAPSLAESALIISGAASGTDDIVNVRPAGGIGDITDRWMRLGSLGTLGLGNTTDTNKSVLLDLRGDVSARTGGQNFVQLVSNSITWFSIGGKGTFVVGQAAADMGDVAQFTLNLSNNAGTTERFRVQDKTGAFFPWAINSVGQMVMRTSDGFDTTFARASGGSDHTLTWPNTQGGASTVLNNDGSGNLSWGAAAAATHALLSATHSDTTAGTPADADSIIRANGTTWKVNTAETAGTAHIDFFTAKAIAMACDNGPILPPGGTGGDAQTPLIGQWFLHTPTGRKFLMQYNGTAWIPIYAFGATTMYVRNTGPAGTNNQNNGGTDDANAFLTVQFAIDQVPPLYSGNITINIAGGTYTETVSIQGKNPVGSFSLILQGAHAASTATGTFTGVGSDVDFPTGPTTGGTFFVDDSTKSFTTNILVHELLATIGGPGSGQTRPIETNTATRIRIIGSWDVTPDTTTTYKVYRPATIIRDIALKPAQTAVVCDSLIFNGTGTFQVDMNSRYTSLTMTNCIIEGGADGGLSFYCIGYATITSCVFNSRSRIVLDGGAYVIFSYCRIHSTSVSSGHPVLRVSINSFCYIALGTTITNGEVRNVFGNTGCIIYGYGNAVGFRARIYGARSGVGFRLEGGGVADNGLASSSSYYGVSGSAYAVNAGGATSIDGTTFATFAQVQ